MQEKSPYFNANKFVIPGRKPTNEPHSSVSDEESPSSLLLFVRNLTRRERYNCRKKANPVVAETVVNNKENNVNIPNIQREVKPNTSKEVKKSTKSAKPVNKQKEDQDFIDEAEVEREAEAKKKRTLIKLPKIFSKPEVRDFKLPFKAKSLKYVKVVNKAALHKKLMMIKDPFDFDEWLKVEKGVRSASTPLIV